MTQRHLWKENFVSLLSHFFQVVLGGAGEEEEKKGNFSHSDHPNILIISFVLSAL